jgi:ribosomal protein S18 acetylase RimI-like enzyme
LETGRKSYGVLIRDFRKSDLDDLLRLLPVSNAEEFKVTGFDPDHTRDMINRLYGWAGRFLLRLLRLFGKRPMKFLVAEDDGKLVGTTIVDDRGKAGSISVVMVHPDYRRRGIATKLMTNALDFIQRGKKVRAILGVISTNTAAIDLYMKLGFTTFEHALYFVGEADSLRVSKDVVGVEVRPFRKGDLDEVYELVVASEDPVRLKIYDFTRKNLRTPFLRRLFSFATQIKLVAAYDGRIVGYAEASYTTPSEVGRIGFIHVNAEGRLLGVEKMLVNAGRSEIEKAGVNRFRVVVPSTRQDLMDAVKDLGFKEAFTVDGMVKELS